MSRIRTEDGNCLVVIRAWDVVQTEGANMEFDSEREKQRQQIDRLG